MAVCKYAYNLPWAVTAWVPLTSLGNNSINITGELQKPHKYEVCLYGRALVSVRVFFIILYTAAIYQYGVMNVF